MKAPVLQLLLPSLLCLAPLTAQNAQPEEDILDVAEDGVPASEETEQLPRRHGEVPAMFRDDAMLDESHTNQELGINVYTAPSINKIFDQLDDLPAIPEEYVLRKRPEKLPTDAGALALEMGYLLADGFIAVRSGHMNDIKPIALDLTRYGKALGVGERMNTHSASLLEQAEKGKLEEFKKTLASTQNDVNSELIALRDPDLSHLIALGGWIRALEASAASLCDRFDSAKARVIFYPDAPEYFHEILQGLDPQTSKKLQVAQMGSLLDELSLHMTLNEQEEPSYEKVKIILETTGKLSTLAVGKGYER